MRDESLREALREATDRWVWVRGDEIRLSPPEDVAYSPPRSQPQAMMVISVDSPATPSAGKRGASKQLVSPATVATALFKRPRSAARPVSPEEVKTEGTGGEAGPGSDGEAAAMEPGQQRTTEALCVGDTIEGQHGTNKAELWWPGTVTGVWRNGDVDVRYDGDDDADAELQKPRSRVRRLQLQLSSRSSTGYRGVSRHEHGRFEAKLDINGFSGHLGTFDTVLEAAEARARAATLQQNKGRRRKMQATEETVHEAGRWARHVYSPKICLLEDVEVSASNGPSASATSSLAVARGNACSDAPGTPADAACAGYSAVSLKFSMRNAGREGLPMVLSMANTPLVPQGAAGVASTAATVASAAVVVATIGRSQFFRRQQTEAR